MRSKAFFINGGAGRVICSIPAFEKYVEANPDEDFIIIAEGGTDFFKGHPTLDGRVYDVWHKGIFEEHIKDRDCVSPEPYRVWHYYNQKCNLSQAYDISINGLEEPRELPKPTINLSKMEVIAGYNVDTGELLWRFFLMPPSGGEKDWAMKYQGLGNVDPTPDDWGDAKNVGVGIATGQWAIDEEAGIVYVGTSSPAPNFNAANRPGPNLFSSSILALDINTGELIWYYQASPHDLYGHGCNWNTVLGNIDDRKVLYKACDDGRLLALDAADGELIWSFLPPDLKFVNVDDSINSQVDVNQKWVTEPSLDAYWQCPGITGGTGGSIAFAYGRIYYISTNYCDYMIPEPSPENDPDSFGAKDMTKLPYNVQVRRNASGIIPDWRLDRTESLPVNSTVYAIDASNGSVDWKYELDAPHRGGLMATGNMVVFGSHDGRFYTLDSETGEFIYSKYVGAALGTTPTIGAAASGEQYIFQPVGGLDHRYGQPVSGVFVSLKIRGGPMVPILDPVVEESPVIDDEELPINVVVPVLLLIVTVFLLASFGPKRILSLIGRN